MARNWELCFLCRKTKQKELIRRASTFFENLIDQGKRFIQLDPTVFDLLRINGSTGIIQVSVFLECPKNFQEKNAAFTFFVIKDTLFS